MIPRLAINDITKALNRQAAVALIGPRQAGKTTLALEIAQQRDAVYLDLEDRDDRRRLAEPGMFLDGLEDRLVILDEIHRTPELFQTLRGVIDRGRRRGKGLGRFLVLGSASVDLLRQTGESLAGRIAYLDLGPFSVLELDNNRDVRERLWLRGGFPDSYLAATEGDSLAWRKDFGAEIDLVIEHPSEETWAIEIKRSLAAKVSRGFHNALEDIRPTRAIVVHAGEDRFPVARNVEGIGVHELAAELGGLRNPK